MLPISQVVRSKRCAGECTRWGFDDAADEAIMMREVIDALEHRRTGAHFVRSLNENGPIIENWA
jgi:hypothetical protein